MQTAIFGEMDTWSFGRLRDIFLILAFCLPSAGIAYGSANGVPLDRLGGVMVVYWAFIGVSLFAAVIEFFKRSPKASSRLGLIAAVAVVPIGAKVMSNVVAQPMPAAPASVEEPSSQRLNSGKGCQLELITRPPLTATASKSGSSGRIAWIFLIGNYYKWDFRLKIEGDSSGAGGTASASVETSAWYSVKLHARPIVATARGNVECKPAGDKCDCFAEPSNDRQTEEDFVLSVDVQSTPLAAGATQKVSASADLAGSMGLSEISVGKDPVQAKLQTPNTARAGISKAKSYSYRCVGF